MAAVEEPRERLLDLIDRILSLEFAKQVAKTAAAFADRRRHRAVKLAVKEEFSIFRIQAHRVGRQQIDAEVRCKLRNVLALAERGGLLLILMRTADARLGAAAHRRWGPILQVWVFRSFCGTSRQSQPLRLMRAQSRAVHPFTANTTKPRAQTKSM